MHVRPELDEPPAKRRCKDCDEHTQQDCVHTLQLDKDLSDWIAKTFPHWSNNNSNNNNSTNIISSSNDNNNNNNSSNKNKTTTSVAEVISTIPSSLNKKMAEGEQPAATSKAAESPLLGSADEFFLRQSPPKVIVDTSPLQPQMDKNKLSLKNKLSSRRTRNELAEQGIYPNLTTSPALHEQRKQLERAKTGDLLKAKIQQRPDRQELERLHILEHEESYIDPSLAEKQRMLKKARLVDQLNSQISHRPGPLELIKKNILWHGEEIDRNIKEGLVTFKATSEGLLNRPQHPNSYITFDEDSQSSEGDSRGSPQRRETTNIIDSLGTTTGILTLTIPNTGGPVVVTSTPLKYHSLIPTTQTYVPPPPPPPLPTQFTIKTENNVVSIMNEPPIMTPLQHHFNIKTENVSIQPESNTPALFDELCKSVVGTVTGLAASPSTTSTLSPLSSVSSPPGAYTPRAVPSPLQPQNNQKSDAPGKDKNRKKSKIKPVQKARTIKFHEYKGPPNAQKQSNSFSMGKSTDGEETGYQLMLDQQYKLIKCIEDNNIQGHQTILPAPSRAQSEMSQPSPAPSSCASSIPPSPAPSYSQESINNNSNNPAINTSSNSVMNGGGGNVSSIDIARLEKMKVSDLKLQLKKRNLPVSGPKPQLIERLRPYLPLDDGTESMSGDQMCDVDNNFNSPKNSMSPESENETTMMDVQQDSPIAPQSNATSLMNEDIVREQQRQIDELQRQLREKQDELLQMKTQQINMNNHEKQQESINQKMIVKQQLEAKIHKEKLQQIENRKQKEQMKLNAMNNNNNNNNSSNNVGGGSQPMIIATQIIPQVSSIQQSSTTTTVSQPAAMITSSSSVPSIKDENNLDLLWHTNDQQTLVFVDLNTENNKRIVNGGHHRTFSMPSILVPITQTNGAPATATITLPSQHQDEDLNQIQHHQQKHQQQQQQQQQQQHNQLPPPEYEEATQQLNGTRESSTSHHTESEAVSDVLEILINHGEISPESALCPTTPSTEENMNIAQNMLFDTTPMHQSSTNHTYSDLSTGSVLNPTNILQNIDCSSPMQSDQNEMNENNKNSLDMLLGQTTVDLHSMNDTNPSDATSKLNNLSDFSNWSTNEQIKNQFDMELGDDCHQYNSLNCMFGQKHNGSDLKSRGLSSNISDDLSLEFNYNNNNTCNGNYYNDSVMDIDLSQLDFISFPPTPSSQHHQQNHQHHNHHNNLDNHLMHNGQMDTPPHHTTFSNCLNDATQNSTPSPITEHGHHHNGVGGMKGSHLNDNIYDFANIDDLKMIGDQMAWESDYPIMNCH